MCVSTASDSSHGDCLRHENASRVINYIDLTFIQGHPDLNHEDNKCLIISESIQAMPIKFAVKIVGLKVYMTNDSPMTLTFIEGRKYVSNLTTF